MLERVLVDILPEEGCEVLVCSTLADVHLALEQAAADLAVLVPRVRSPQVLSGEERVELTAVGAAGPTLIVSVDPWLATVQPSELQAAELIPAPCDLEVLLAAVRRLTADLREDAAQTRARLQRAEGMLDRSTYLLDEAWARIERQPPT
jgi:DNA-binding NtrC family response regulator